VVGRPEVGLADVEADGTGRSDRFVGDLTNAGVVTLGGPVG